VEQSGVDTKETASIIDDIAEVPSRSLQKKKAVSPLSSFPISCMNLCSLAFLGAQIKRQRSAGAQVLQLDASGAGQGPWKPRDHGQHALQHRPAAPPHRLASSWNHHRHGIIIIIIIMESSSSWHHHHRHGIIIIIMESSSLEPATSSSHEFF
jgi:hypothetical protein